MPKKKSSTAWCDREINQQEQQDRRRIISNWVKCSVCDRTRIPRKQYLAQGRVCQSCKETHKDAPLGKGLDINRMVARREDSNAKP